jgi:hypothetical protein
MKKYTTILFLFLFLFQYNLIIAQPNTLGINADYSTVLYLGLENPISIISAVQFDNVTIDNGILKQESKNKYLVSPNNLGNATIKLFSNNKLIHEQIFKVKNIPEPILTIGFKENKINLPELLAHNTIGCIAKNFDYDACFLVTSYEISFKSLDGKLNTFKGNNNIISNDFKSAVSANGIEENGKIIINAEVKSPVGKTLKLSAEILIQL